MPEAGPNAPQPTTPQPTPPAPAPVEVLAPVDWRRVHLTQIQPIRDAAVILLFFGLFKLGYLLSAVTVPLLIAILLAYLFEPVVKKLTQGGRMRRPVAVGAIVAAIVIGVGGPVLLGLTFASVQAVTYAEKMVSNIEILRASYDHPEDRALAAKLPNDSWRAIRDVLVGLASRGSLETGPANPAPANPPTPTDPSPSATPPGSANPPEPSGAGGSDVPASDTIASESSDHGPVSAGSSIDRLLDSASKYIKQNAESIGKVLGKGALGTGTGAVQALFHLVGRIGFILFSTFLTLLFFFFISTGWARFTSSVVELIPDWRRARVLDLMGKMDRVIAAFVRGRLTIMMILMGEYIIAYWIIGVPAPLLVGVIVGVLTLAPFMSALGVPLCIVLMWLQPVGPLWQQAPAWIILAPLVTYFVIQATDDYFWTPTIQGKATDMDMPTILFAVLSGGILAGFYGVLVAIPVGACLKILIREVAYPRIKAWAAGKVRDPLPISRYSPVEAKQEGAPPSSASAS